MKTRVIIIGAGPAGLTAAYELSKHPQYSVTVLEADGVAGGISRTVVTQNNRMDLGGHRFFSKDKRVQQWWFNLFPAQGSPSMDDKILGRPSVLTNGGPDPEKQDNVFLIRKRLSRIYYRHTFFNYPLSLSFQTLWNLGVWNLCKAGCSYLAACVHKRSETSLENFYINRFGKTLYRMFFEGYTEKLWGRHPRDISADWGAQRVKGLSVRAVLKDLLQRLLHQKNKKKSCVISTLTLSQILPRNKPTLLSRRVWIKKYSKKCRKYTQFYKNHWRTALLVLSGQQEQGE